MARRDDRVVGCIGICNMKDLKLFKDRRGDRRPAVVPISESLYLPPMSYKGMSINEQRKLEEKLREKRNQDVDKRLLPIRRGIRNVKRMQTRRDRAKQ